MSVEYRTGPEDDYRPEPEYRPGPEDDYRPEDWLYTLVVEEWLAGDLPDELLASFVFWFQDCERLGLDVLWEGMRVTRSQPKPVWVTSDAEPEPPLEERLTGEARRHYRDWLTWRRAFITALAMRDGRNMGEALALTADVEGPEAVVGLLERRAAELEAKVDKSREDHIRGGQERAKERDGDYWGDGRPRSYDELVRELQQLACESTYLHITSATSLMPYLKRRTTYLGKPKSLLGRVTREGKPSPPEIIAEARKSPSPKKLSE